MDIGNSNCEGWERICFIFPFVNSTKNGFFIVKAGGFRRMGALPR